MSQPGMLAELMPGIDASWRFAYSAPVVKEREFRLDGVFKLLSDDVAVPIVFVEAQMQADENFYRRYCAEIFLYLEQYKIDLLWQGLLILRSRGQHLGETAPYEYLLDASVVRLYLSDLKQNQSLSPNLALLQLLTTDQTQTAEVGKALLQEAETDAEFERRLSLIETILANKFPDLTREMIMQILDLKKMDITRSKFYQEIIAEGRQEGRQEGHLQGRQEGLQEGRQEEAANLVLRQLMLRLGALSVDQSN